MLPPVSGDGLFWVTTVWSLKEELLIEMLDICGSEISRGGEVVEAGKSRLVPERLH